MYAHARGKIHLSSRLSACTSFEEMSLRDRGKLVVRPVSCGATVARWWCGMKQDQNTAAHRYAEGTKLGVAERTSF